MLGDIQVSKPYSSSDDVIQYIIRRTHQNNDSVYLRNMSGIPLFVSVGQNDQLRSFYSAKLIRLLSSQEIDTTMMTKRVIPIYENDYEPETNFKFTHFSYRGYDAPVKYGIQVVQPRVPQRFSSLSAAAEGEKCIIRTDNVRRLSVSGADMPITIKSVTIDDIQVKYENDKYYMYKRLSPGDDWEVDTNFSWSLEERSMLTYPPLSKLFSSEVYIILPSKPRYSPSVYNRAARRIASAWHKIAAGKCYIVQDDFLSNGGIVKNILVSLGTPGENRIVDIIMKNKKKDTVSFHEDENFKIGPRAYAGPDFGFVSQVSANISSKTALIIHGNSEEALDRVVLYLILGSKFNIPDYAVVGKSRFSTGSKVNEDHMREGSDGPKSPIQEIDIRSALAFAGYWSLTWEYDVYDSYVNII